jgi:putative ABC transport system ATP-binding protein
MIKVNHVTKTYRQKKVATEVLKGISLEVKDGEFLAIVGASGSGKSTLLNIIGGMDRQTGGEYYYDDICVSQLNEKKLAKFRNQSIGFVFQSFHLANELNALDNVGLPLGYAGVGGKARKKRSMALLNEVGLQNLWKQHPYELSGGEQQRVALARALANHPKVLLADEPTGNLDRETGHKIMELLSKQNEMGVTIIMVTHDMELAGMADRIVRIEDGRLREE